MRQFAIRRSVGQLPEQPTANMPYRPEAELKRPDLKGEFVCATCHKTFCHAASLNRHRLNFHGGNHFCTLCKEVIQTKETVRRHMAIHGFERIFTCGCCNWAFPDKKELHIHTSSMAKYNEPGSAQVIATTASATGEAPAIGVFKEPKKVREQRAAAKAAAAAAAVLANGHLPTTSHASPPSLIGTPKRDLSAPPLLMAASTPPTGLLPTFPASNDIYMQLIAQLMAGASMPQHPMASPLGASTWGRAFLLNSPLLAQPDILSSLAANLSAAATHASPPHIDISAATTVSSSGLPSGSGPSLLSGCGSAQDTESERVVSDDEERKMTTSMSPMTSSDDFSSASPSSSLSTNSPRQHGEKNNNAGMVVPSSSRAIHSIASLISPKHEDYCSSSPASSSDGTSPRHTPSPMADTRKRRRTINDVVSFLHTKQVKTEEE